MSQKGGFNNAFYIFFQQNLGRSHDGHITLHDFLVNFSSCDFIIVSLWGYQSKIAGGGEGGSLGTANNEGVLNGPNSENWPPRVPHPLSMLTCLLVTKMGGWRG